MHTLRVCSNGLLINHQIVEVNGQNVVGLPDKDLLQILREAPRSVTLTIMPTFLYEYLVKKYVSINRRMSRCLLLYLRCETTCMLNVLFCI
jgi:hypothetical protein